MEKTARTSSETLTARPLYRAYIQEKNKNPIKRKEKKSISRETENRKQEDIQLDSEGMEIAVGGKRDTVQELIENGKVSKDPGKNPVRIRIGDSIIKRP